MKKFYNPEFNKSHKNVEGQLQYFHLNRKYGSKMNGG